MTEEPRSRVARASRSLSIFEAVARRPVWVLLAALLPTLVVGTFALGLEKDTRNEAYMAPDHPAVLYRQKVEEIFGLKDPMVVAVVRDAPGGVFTPDTLALLQWLTERVAAVPGIDPDRVTSLATEKNIVGSLDGMEVAPFYEVPPATQEEADAIRAAVLDLDLAVGKLVSADASTALVVAELLPDQDAQRVYEDILALATEAPVNAGETLHVAGEGATNGFVGAYIDADAQRLNPIAILVILAILGVCYRTLRGVLLPMLVVAGSICWALGSMAAAGVPFYGITTTLTVVLIAIGVADAVHILGQYYEERARDPGATRQELAVRSIHSLWRAVTLTSVTSIAGFLALSLSSSQPPMRWFGIFASVGVLSALGLSLLVIPALLAWLPPQSSPAFRAGRAVGGDLFARMLGTLGGASAAHPARALGVAVLLIGVCGVAASQVRLDDSRIRYFQESEPIYQADQAINRSMDGTGTLEVVFEADAPEALYRPESLRKIEALQSFMQGLPNVGGTISIVDYVKQMNRAMNEGRRDAYAIPDDENLIAQYFLLYSSGGDPTDFEELVSSDFRMANLRVRMTRGLWSDYAAVVDPAQRFIDATFRDDSLRATLAGAVKVGYHRAEDLRESHPLGVALAFVAVFVVTALSLRSAVAGLLAVLPVGVAVLSLYAVMGGFDIWLGSGTAMTAAIAIGLAVDFSVHTLDRLIVYLREQRRTLDEALALLFPTTGRALLFSFVAIVLGFGVLCTSRVPSLQDFGVLVGVLVASGFLSTLILTPALVRLTRPRFLAPAASLAGGVARVAPGASSDVAHAASRPSAQSSS